MLSRLVVALLALMVAVGASGQQPATTPDFHGTYEELKPQQKQLLDEWYADYNKLTGDHASAKEYNQFSLSTRTTYEAVTHALMTTQLTDKSGKPMGTALDLVEAIEAISGKVPKSRGDLQFRMYVVLQPDALHKLKDSQEFFRDHDNTVYHHGYPLNYRQDGTPSIQFSMSKDGRHADIDVDYRSSKIPQGLFNGHLTAANSDVRAGNNTQVHLQRWQGLADWWRSLFGLAAVKQEEGENLLPGDVPGTPRKGDGKLEEAMQDFLQSWLVEGKPELAAAYLAPSSFACLEEYGPQSGRVMNVGNAPYVAAKDLAATGKAIGKVSNVSAVVKPATLTEPGIQAVKQPYATTFSVYALPNAMVAEYECDPEKAYAEFDKARTAGTSGKPGGYYAAVFRLKTPQRMTDPVTLVWAKQGKTWKVVSWELEPAEAKPGAMPDLRKQRAAAVQKAQASVAGDPAAVAAAEGFLRAWLVEDNFEAAAKYVSAKADACVGLYLEEGEKAPATKEEYAAYLRKTLTTVGQEVGTVKQLSEAMEPVRADHEGLKRVTHKDSDAYAMVAVPDSLVGTFACEERSKAHPYEADDAAKKVYGNYYATMFSFKTPGEHAAALTLLWGKDGGAWKIVAYEVAAP